MRAVVFNNGRVEVAERPSPTPGTDDLLVRVASAGLNGADLIQLSGNYAAPPGVVADIPGLEIAGEVVARGEKIQRYDVGARVMAVIGGGGQAELAIVQERLAMAVPDEIELGRAGGIPEVFATADDALFTQAKLQPGERLLVTGAAGGVGLAAIQLGLAAGASVIASVRSETRRPEVAAFGAFAIDPSEVAEHGPYDVVLELVGAPSLPSALSHLAPNARVSVIGTRAGSRFELDLRLLMGARAKIMGSTLRARSLEERALVARQVEKRVLPLLANGRARVPVDSTYSLEHAPEAYERFAAGGKFGKVILTMEP